MPADFEISASVAAWAAAHGYDRLDEHLETFKLKVRANGYTRVDWDAALMVAIGDDWAGFRKRTHAAKAEELAAQLAPLVAMRTSHKAVVASSPTPFDFGLPMVERVDDE